MYANLAVTVTTPDGECRSISAWNVVTAHDGTTEVFTDLNDGESSYPEEGPVVKVPAGSRIDIEACF